MFILGLTAPVQTGKIQLTPIFEEHGWHFIDLNDFIYERRQKGTVRHNFYQQQWPGSLDDEGVETGKFYQAMDLVSFQHLLREDMSYVTQRAREEMSKLPPDTTKVVLSWEYLAQIASTIEISHLVIFQSEQSVWFSRLKARALELGWKQLPSDETLWHIITILDVHPATILSRCQSCFPAEKISCLDVSNEDWGASQLAKFLRAL